MLHSWRTRNRQTGSFEDQKPQQAEITRLKRENIRLQDEVAFLKKQQRTFIFTTTFNYKFLSN